MHNHVFNQLDFNQAYVPGVKFQLKEKKTKYLAFYE